jgi:hypothetical protein
MRRRNIDSRRISARRPELSQKENVSASGFADSLKRFADEYLRGAMKVTIEGSSIETVSISLRDAAYMFRLMVEWGGEDAMTEAHIRICEHMTIDVKFPSGLPSVEQLSDIARAGRVAGFFFDVRADRIIVRAPLEVGKPVAVYASDFDKIINIFEKIFFM